MSDSELEPKKSEYLFLCDEPENDVMALWSEFMDDDDDEDVLDQKIAEAFSGISEQWGASPELIHDWKNSPFYKLMTLEEYIEMEESEEFENCDY